MSKLKQFIEKYVFSDDLSLDARMINMVCMVGMATSLVAAVARFAMRPSGPMSLVMIGIVASVGFLMFFCNWLHWYTVGTWVALLALCDILFPLAFFFLGGTEGGMPAYFVLSIVLIPLLLRGKKMIVFLITHILIIMFCLYAGYKYPHLVVKMGGFYQVMDNIQAFLISGFFISVVILFQNRMYKREKQKVDEAGSMLVRQDKLLHVINDAATLLLSSEAGKFEDVLGQSMEMMARNMDVDQVHVWKNELREDGLVYFVQQYSWTVNRGFRQRFDGDRLEYAYVNRLPRWHEHLAGGNCINGFLALLPPDEQKMFIGHGIKSLLVIPVFLQQGFWGFVSFDDCHRDRIFPDDEAGILRSGSLLLANALIRHEVMQNMVKAREEALSGARAKSEFLANMSHEIRTPMNAIIGMTSIAKSTGDIERKDACLKKIEDASTHLLGIINDILDMSKIEANKLELSFVSFDFEKMLQRVVNVINFRVDEKQQQFSVHIDRSIPRFLIGDDQRLAQVITNLLSNAVKFTPDHGLIKLETYLEKEEGGIYTIRISVSDTGIGISPEQQARLFNSFQQADSNTSRKFGGTGLGLVISKRIVEMMGGTIWIESEEGKGSTFIFTLQAQRDTEEQGRLLDAGVTWGNVRILAIDDDLYVRDYFKEIAQQFNIHCDTVSSGEEAMSTIEKNGPYDIYFVDWKMPGMNGIEIAKRIRAYNKTHFTEEPKSVVTMISSAEWNLIEKEAKSAGVNNFLPKPLFPSAISDCISQCLGENALPSRDEGIPSETDNFSGRRILLAEDVEINREIVLTLLEPTGLIIDCAENGAEVVKLFSASPDNYEMIFMDVQMPEMDGYEATRTIRELEQKEGRAAIPIIAMTANVFKEDIEKCLAAGMNDHVGKPLDFDEVLKRLRTYLP